MRRKKDLKLKAVGKCAQRNEINPLHQTEKGMGWDVKIQLHFGSCRLGVGLGLSVSAEAQAVGALLGTGR